VARIDKGWQSLHDDLMNISLTPELEKWVKAKVNSGLYNNSSEVIREALRESLRREGESDWLGTQARIGHAQLEAGGGIPVTSREAFVALVRESV